MAIRRADRWHLAAHLAFARRGGPSKSFCRLLIFLGADPIVCESTYPQERRANPATAGGESGGSRDSARPAARELMSKRVAEIAREDEMRDTVPATVFQK